MCEHRGNIVLFLFFGQEAAMDCFEKEIAWLIGMHSSGDAFGHRYIDDRLGELVGVYRDYFA